MYDREECGSPLIPTPSGSRCSKGCGKILPKLPPAAARINEAVVAGFEQAKSIHNGWAIGGMHYNRKKVASGPVGNLIGKPGIAIFEGRVYCFYNKEAEK